MSNQELIEKIEGQKKERITYYYSMDKALTTLTSPEACKNYLLDLISKNKGFYWSNPRDGDYLEEILNVYCFFDKARKIVPEIGENLKNFEFGMLEVLIDENAYFSEVPHFEGAIGQYTGRWIMSGIADILEEDKSAFSGDGVTKKIVNNVDLDYLSSPTLNKKDKKYEQQSRLISLFLTLNPKMVLHKTEFIDVEEAVKLIKKLKEALQ